MVGLVGLEPTRFSATDFESVPATNYGIAPYIVKLYHYLCMLSTVYIFDYIQIHDFCLVKIDAKEMSVYVCEGYHT